jgi:membrane-associated phospholipid phosphatase
MGNYVKKELNMMINLLFALGYFSEFIMLIIVIFVMYPNLLDMIFYLFFLVINGLLNVTLKSIIKQPRPEEYTKFLYSEHRSRKHPAYGMPSGHSQNVFYSITYLYLTAKDWIEWLPVGLLMATLMVIERYIFHNHTLLQLFAGALLGIIFGFLVVYIRNKTLLFYSSSLILGAK